MCPPIEHQPERCRTCCCQSSDNVEFLDSDFVCNEDEDVHYKVAFKYNLNSRCHPEYFSNSVNETPYFSGLAISSLGYREIFDRCTKSPGLGSNVNADSWRSYLEGRQREGAVLAFFISDKHLQRSSRPRLIRSGYVRVNPTHPYLTFVSQLVRADYMCVIIIIVQKFEYFFPNRLPTHIKDYILE